MLTRINKPNYRKLSDDKLINFVKRNPGCTAALISLGLHRNCGTISGWLYKLVKKRKLSRSNSVGMRGGKAWRYYAKSN